MVSAWQKFGTIPAMLRPSLVFLGLLTSTSCRSAKPVERPSVEPARLSGNGTEGMKTPSSEHATVSKAEGVVPVGDELPDAVGDFSVNVTREMGLSSEVEETRLPELSSSPAQNTCCRTCRQGKACGDTCISIDRTCHRAPGCACNTTP